MGVSVVVHPRNPYVPTAHMNVRFIAVNSPLRFRPQKSKVETRKSKFHLRWFGGGFDLTPTTARVRRGPLPRNAGAVAPFGQSPYARFKAWCAGYFFLTIATSRAASAASSSTTSTSSASTELFALRSRRRRVPRRLPAHRRAPPRRSVRRARARLPGLRRGRYVEFNLLYDRGTLFGLQTGGRAETILMSLPPLVRWEYDRAAAPARPRRALYTDFLRPRDWITP